MSGLRVGVHLQRWIPFLGFHHNLMIIQTTVVILISILLAGCSSYSTMTAVYILELSYANSTLSNPESVQKTMYDTLNELKGRAQLEVRIGYFGISDSNGLAQQIGSENDPLNLIGAASSFKDDVLFSGLRFMSIVLAFFCIVLLATSPGWHAERDPVTGSDVDVKPFPSRPVSQVAFACTFVASVLLLIASLWQHIGAVGAAAMAGSANYGNVKTVIGAGAMSVSWIGFTLTTIVTSGLSVIFVSIINLDRLTDD